MTTYGASLDYWTDSTMPSGRTISSVISKNIMTPTAPAVASSRRANRNRFLRFLLINALIWPLLAFVALQVFESHSPAVSKSLLKISGAQAMTADELTSIVSGQGRPIFWLGRLSGDTYSENSTVRGVDVITYLPENATPQFANQLDLVVKTYRDTNIFNVRLHPLSGTADTTVENVGGVTVTYNPASPDHSVVTFKDRPQVITMTYPGFQSISTLVMDAQNLAPIQSRPAEDQHSSLNGGQTFSRLPAPSTLDLLQVNFTCTNSPVGRIAELGSLCTQSGGSVVVPQRSAQ